MWAIINVIYVPIIALFVISLFVFRYCKKENLNADSPEIVQYTHLLVEAKSKYSQNLKPYTNTFEIIESVEGFSHIAFNYNSFPPIKIKTKPQIFILSRINENIEIIKDDVLVDNSDLGFENDEIIATNSVKLSTGISDVEEINSDISDEELNSSQENINSQSMTNENNKISKIVSNKNIKREVNEINESVDDGDSKLAGGKVKENIKRIIQLYKEEKTNDESINSEKDNINEEELDNNNTITIIEEINITTNNSNETETSVKIKPKIAIKKIKLKEQLREVKNKKEDSIIQVPDIKSLSNDNEETDETLENYQQIQKNNGVEGKLKIKVKEIINKTDTKEVPKKVKITVSETIENNVDYLDSENVQQEEYKVSQDESKINETLTGLKKKQINEKDIKIQENRLNATIKG